MTVTRYVVLLPSKVWYKRGRKGHDSWALLQGRATALTAREAGDVVDRCGGTVVPIKYDKEVN